MIKIEVFDPLNIVTGISQSFENEHSAYLLIETKPEWVDVAYLNCGDKDEQFVSLFLQSADRFSETEICIEGFTDAFYQKTRHGLYVVLLKNCPIFSNVAFSWQNAERES